MFLALRSRHDTLYMHLSDSLSVVQGAWLGRIQTCEALIDQLPVAYQFRSRLWMEVVVAAAETLGFLDSKDLQLPVRQDYLTLQSLHLAPFAPSLGSSFTSCIIPEQMRREL